MNPQGSQAWIEERLGYVTASRFADCMTKSRSGSGLSKTAEAYLVDLIGESLTRHPASTLKTYEMDWGNKWEPVAREAYQTATKADVQQVGFVTHPTERFVACSPDSLVGDAGTLEIKCPATAAPHLGVLLSGKVPDEHVAQIQGVMWITSRKWCDFVSYNHRFPTELRMAVIRVLRDDFFIEEMSDRVLAFRDEMISRMKQLIEFWKGQIAA